MSRKERVLITGGTGFIGTNLTRKLLKEKYDVHLIIRPESNLWRLKDIKKLITFHKINLENINSIKNLAKKITPSFIFHLAAYGSSSFETNIEKIYSFNTTSIVNLLLATKNINYKKLVNTGSSSEYGFKKNAMKENDVLVPNSFYSASKASSTYFSQVFAKQFNKPIVNLRPFSVYGPYESSKRFIPTIILNSINNKPIGLTNKKAVHDFIFIDDLIQAYIKVMKTKTDPGDVFNLGTGREYSNETVIKTLHKITNIQTPIKTDGLSLRPWDSIHWRADIKKAKKNLKWTANYSLEKGLLKTYKWFLKNKNLYEN